MNTDGKLHVRLPQRIWLNLLTAVLTSFALVCLAYMVINLRSETEELQRRTDLMRDKISSLETDIDNATMKTRSLEKTYAKIDSILCVTSQQNYILKEGNVFYANGRYKRILLKINNQWAFMRVGMFDTSLVLKNNECPECMGYVKTLQELEGYMRSNNYTTQECSND
jgi:hypothetical protein